MTAPLQPTGEAYKELLSKGLKPDRSVDELRTGGLDLPAGAAGTVSLFELDGPEGPEVWLGYHNFYVITRYNHSALYAMAVYQLSEAIRSRAGDALAQLRPTD